MPRPGQPPLITCHIAGEKLVQLGMVQNSLRSTENTPGMSAAERRKRYAAAMDAVTGGICPTDLIDAVMAVADAELRTQQDRQIEQATEVLNKYADGEIENARLREELRKAKRAANLLAADHRAVERVQRRLDAWEQRLPENVQKATVIEVLRRDLDDAA